MATATQVLCGLVSLLVGVRSTPGLECGGANSSCDIVDGDAGAFLQMQSRQVGVDLCFDSDLCKKSDCTGDKVQIAYAAIYCRKTCGFCLTTTTTTTTTWKPCPYDDGVCYARREACGLYHILNEKTWHNQNITLVRDELKEICNGHFNSRGPQHTQKIRDNHKGMEKCTGDDNACVLDVKEYLDTNPGAEYIMDAASVAASTVVGSLAIILEDAKMIATVGKIAFGFMGNILGAFFPSAGDLPANPCTYASDDWAKCVWEQIQPFVAQFVDQKIDGVFSELWQQHIQGYQHRMNLIQGEADFDSDHFDNGTISNMSQTVFDKMMTSLYSLHETMTSDAPLFAADHNDNTVAGVYLPMFASMHSGVMSNLWSSPKYRTPGFRFVTQKSMICYARKIVNRVVNAMAHRLNAVKVVQGSSSQYCGQYGNRCPYATYEYQDNFPGCNFWKLKCDNEVGCTPPNPNNNWRAGCTPITKDCRSSQQKQTYDCHRKNVIEQSENLWQAWLSPVPDMLRSVVSIQQFEVHKPQDVAGNLGRFEDPCF